MTAVTVRRTVAAVAAALSAGACAGGGSKSATATTSSAPGSTSPSTSAAPAPTEPSTTGPTTTAGPGGAAPTTAVPPDSRGKLSADSRLRVDGIGPVRAGMTVAEARAAAGVPLESTPGSYCTSLMPKVGTPGGLGLELVVPPSGRVEMISVSGAILSSDRGVHSGSPEAEVKRAYGDQVTVRVAGPDRHLLVVHSPDPALAGFSMAFEGDHGLVLGMRSGIRSLVEADEACG